MGGVFKSGNIWLQTDHFNGCLSFGLQCSDINSLSFAIFCSKVVLDGLADCAILYFADFDDSHFFAYFFFHFTDYLFHFWLVVITRWNDMHFRRFWACYFDLLQQTGLIYHCSLFGSFILQ